jgi:bifunctional non-homologous end joining protein LigD
MDPPDDPERRPAPRDLLPMRATSGAAPTTNGWAFELKYSGLRALLVNEPGLVTLSGEDGADITRGFPEVRRIGRALGAEEVILDGVLLCDAGPESFERRLAAKSDSTVRRIARDQPAVFAAFDLIWHDGHACWQEPWQRRRERLDGLHLDGDHWRAPPAHIGDGADLMAAARAAGVEALVAKRTDARYEAGTTSDDWRIVSVEG